MKKIKYCLLALLCPLLSMAQTHSIQGKLLNEDNQPLQAATIQVKNSERITTTDHHGEFTMHHISIGDLLIISAVGYLKKEYTVEQYTDLTIILNRKITELDEVIVQAYGTTTRRLNTGNIAKLSASEIEKQPVNNPLAALSGRVPGMIVTESSGVPGASVKIEIRGRTSLDPSISGNDPLFIIDGIPFAPGNMPFNQLRSAANNPRSASEGGLSPFSMINPTDIESIEVLKDADATAIYGSRGANGVILISTKKGKAGRTVVNVNINKAFSKVTRTMPMLNTVQYLEMRKEAFFNDGNTPSVNNAPDLLVWDTTRYTDYKEYFIGGTALNTNVSSAISGGNVNTQFLLSGNYLKQTTVYPGDFSNNRGSVHFNLNHTSTSKKFNAGLSGLYATGNSNMLQTDLTSYINLPPNYPSFYDENGKIKWEEGGSALTNPMAELERTYTNKTDNLSANLLLSYNITPVLKLKSSLGYNYFTSNEFSAYPVESIDPQSSQTAFSNFGNSILKSWIAEPQIEYTPSWKLNIINFLVGATWQQQTNELMNLNARGYTADMFLSSIAASPLLNGSNIYSLYRYNAIFARLNFDHQHKYILNFTARRDATSRFGPGRQFGNFGSAAIAWLFSNENFLKKYFHILSFAKLRASYGITGNDQVGNYKYLNSWENTLLTYQNIPGLSPIRLYNPDYSWEKNRKWETALDLAFNNDKYKLSLVYYNNFSDNRLVNYTLPVQTGFNSVLQNWNAAIRNSGWEIMVSADIIQKKDLIWTSALNVTFPKNKLIRFPGLELSSYRNTYLEGYSLSVINALKFMGVDSANGNYLFMDKNNDGAFNSSDYEIKGDTDPKYYGGFTNTINYKNWQLTSFIEVRNQTGLNYFYTQSSAVPGYGLNNQPVFVLDRWQKPGDITLIQRFTSRAGNPAYIGGAINLPKSDAVFTNASFIRVKTISISYQLPLEWLTKAKLQQCRVYLQSQNPFTITNYKGADPENQNLFVLPPMKTIAAGIQLTF